MTRLLTALLIAAAIVVLCIVLAGLIITFQPWSVS